MVCCCALQRVGRELLFSKFAFGYQKRSSLITVGTSQGFALSFAFLSAASHRWRVHSSATMVSATLNLPCVGHSKPGMAGMRKLLGRGFADRTNEGHGLRLAALHSNTDPLTKK